MQENKMRCFCEHAVSVAILVV